MGRAADKVKAFFGREEQVWYFGDDKVYEGSRRIGKLCMIAKNDADCVLYDLWSSRSEDESKAKNMINYYFMASNAPSGQSIIEQV